MSDSQAVCTQTVRSAVAAAREAAPDLELLAGGHSFGGRMTSTAVAETPLDGVRLAFDSASEDGKRDGSDIVKLSGPADVRAIFNRARHFDFGPSFAGTPWDDRPTLGPNVSRFPSAIPAGQRGGLVACSGEALPVLARRRFD